MSHHVLLPDRPQVRRDPVDQQPRGVPVKDHHKDDRQKEHQAALVGVCRGRGDERARHLRPHVQKDQDHQRHPGRLVGDVGDEQEFRRAGSDDVAAYFRQALDGVAHDFDRVFGDLAVVGDRAVQFPRVVFAQLLAADIELEVRPQHVEKGDEHRQLQQQGQAGGQRVDFVLPVELHDLLLLALLVLLVLLFQRVDLRGHALHLLHRLQLPVGDRHEDCPNQDRQTHDRQPPAEAEQDVIVNEHHDRFEQGDQRREGVLDHIRREDRHLL